MQRHCHIQEWSLCWSYKNDNAVGLTFPANGSYIPLLYDICGIWIVIAVPFEIFVCYKNDNSKPVFLGLIGSTLF